MGVLAVQSRDTMYATPFRQEQVQHCILTDQKYGISTRLKRTIMFRRFFESLGRIINGPAILYEDNNAAIQQIQAEKLTSRIKHLDIMMTWLHEQHKY